jgi:hypothetical protein
MDSFLFAIRRVARAQDTATAADYFAVRRRGRQRSETRRPPGAGGEPQPSERARRLELLAVLLNSRDGRQGLGRKVLRDLRGLQSQKAREGDPGVKEKRPLDAGDESIRSGQARRN